MVLKPLSPKDGSRPTVSAYDEVNGNTVPTIAVATAAKTTKNLFKASSQEVTASTILSNAMCPQRVKRDDDYSGPDRLSAFWITKSRY